LRSNSEIDNEIQNVSNNQTNAEAIGPNGTSFTSGVKRLVTNAG